MPLARSMRSYKQLVPAQLVMEKFGPFQSKRWYEFELESVAFLRSNWRRKS
jgi:hypothetical protein